MFPDLTRDDVFRIETRRLWLRWPRAADLGAILRLAGEAAVAETTARIAHPIDRQDIERHLLRTRRDNADGASLTMAIALLANPAQLIGTIGIDSEVPGVGSLHYWIGQPHWGRGLASEAVTAMVDAFFAYAGGSMLTADVMTINPASRAVVERCGFVHTGSGVKTFPARGGERAVDDFSLDRATWEKQIRDGSRMAMGRIE